MSALPSTRTQKSLKGHQINNNKDALSSKLAAAKVFLEKAVDIYERLKDPN